MHDSVQKLPSGPSMHSSFKQSALPTHEHPNSPRPEHGSSTSVSVEVPSVSVVPSVSTFVVPSVSLESGGTKIVSLRLSASASSASLTEPLSSPS